ncbi:MAG: LPD38 domain-containing protein, partial [Pigmentiphaga sp.]
DYRYKQSTSMVARGVSTAGNAVTGDNFLSPVQVDHVVRAYFGWLGAFVVGGADMMVRAASDEPAKPATDYWKTATGGMASKLDGAHSRYVSQMYDQAREIEQAYGTWRNLLKTGKIEEAAEYRDDNADKLGRYKLVEKIKGASSKINERIREIERSDMDSAAKRVAINELRKRQSDIAKRLVN